jgi:hypothetical protein
MEESKENLRKDTLNITNESVSDEVEKLCFLQNGTFNSNRISFLINFTDLSQMANV